ncbi:hypothetical protein [Sulfolobus tengchongensis spindle-shaped virus 4]|nr:hypothetical protein [Sulfolobus tengchongensis spindle-shaped virus 4]
MFATAAPITSPNAVLNVACKKFVRNPVFSHLVYNYSISLTL